MEFEELLAHLSKACGFGRLEPDELHMVQLKAGESVLTIVGDPITRKVVLYSEIGDLPPEGREAFYMQALKANWLLQGGGGAVLAINPDTDVLSLNRMHPMDSLDGEGFVNLVRLFLEVLSSWRKLASDWRGALEAGTVNPSGGSHTPDDSPAPRLGDPAIRV